ncbi:MAG: UDP-N-acetylmuramoyl-L-alanine--D-glutamate ligase [Proteobacteria bacterium]|nr:MAG: UDP-N-acetylmuramoyl-L-alanine--D-glutamate ligase [Pseudomonadota bacterium]
MGLSGEAAKRLLKRNGVKPSDLITFDDKPGAANYSDPQKMMDEKNPRTLVVSPGYPLSKEWIQDFVEHGGEVTSELALGLHYLTSERVIGVTGAVGKSTTVSLLEAGLAQFSPDSFVGGNIGKPLADYVADLQENKRKRAPWIVLELSSYQLENCGNLECEYSAITYLTANHVDRYESVEAYYDTKWELVKRTRRAVILNLNGGELKRYAKGRDAGAQLLWTDQNDQEIEHFEIENAKLLGSHNQDNIAVATKLAREAGWPAAAIQGMKDFPGLSHRMENLGERSGVRFVNDSKATTMESVRTAAFGIYNQMDRKKSLVLMLGGKDKNLPWEELKELYKIQKIKPVYFGAVAERAFQGVGLEGPRFAKLGDALKEVKKIAEKGDTVLLSPGGTSLDEFKNFEERGKFFTDKVKELFKA